jgi:hypothetical protein
MAPKNLREPEVGVQPVKRRRRHDRVESRGQERPLVEGSVDDVDRRERGEVAPGDLGQPGPHSMATTSNPRAARGTVA